MALNAPSASSSFEAANDYQLIAASTSAKFQGQKGGTQGGKVGDYIRIVTIVPETTSPGAVTIQDGVATAITIFVGGATSVQGLAPSQVFLDLRCVGAGWTIACGAAVHALVSGDAQ